LLDLPSLDLQNEDCASPQDHEVHLTHHFLAMSRKGDQMEGHTVIGRNVPEEFGDLAFGMTLGVDVFFRRDQPHERFTPVEHAA
jgi:hypothetical protein